MIRSVLFSMILSALLIYAVYRVYGLYQQTTPVRLTRVDIYSDRITYGNRSYATPTLFRIGLLAAHDRPHKIALHECDGQTELEAVIDIVRAEGYTSFEVELPEDC